MLFHSFGFLARWSPVHGILDGVNDPCYWKAGYEIDDEQETG